MQSRNDFGEKPPRKVRPIESWRVLHKPAPYGDPLKVLRIEVTYLTGLVKILSVSFKNRQELDNYVNRFHPEFSEKENVGAD